jgi:hypothetical protein
MIGLPLLWQVSMCSLVGISLNRYMNVRFALAFKRFFSFWRTWTYILLSWLMAFVLVVIPFAVNDKLLGFRSDLHACLFDSKNEQVTAWVSVFCLLSLVLVMFFNHSTYIFWRDKRQALIKHRINVLAGRTDMDSGTTSATPSRSAAKPSVPAPSRKDERSVSQPSKSTTVSVAADEDRPPEGRKSRLFSRVMDSVVMSVRKQITINKEEKRRANENAVPGDEFLWNSLSQSDDDFDDYEELPALTLLSRPSEEYKPAAPAKRPARKKSKRIKKNSSAGTWYRKSSVQKRAEKQQPNQESQQQIKVSEHVLSVSKSKSRSGLVEGDSNLALQSGSVGSIFGLVSQEISTMSSTGSFAVAVAKWTGKVKRPKDRSPDPSSLQVPDLYGEVGKKQSPTDAQPATPSSKLAVHAPSNTDMPVPTPQPSLLSSAQRLPKISLSVQSSKTSTQALSTSGNNRLLPTTSSSQPVKLAQGQEGSKVRMPSTGTLSPPTAVKGPTLKETSIMKGSDDLDTKEAKKGTKERGVKLLGTEHKPRQVSLQFERSDNVDFQRESAVDMTMINVSEPSTADGADGSRRGSVGAPVGSDMRRGSSITKGLQPGFAFVYRKSFAFMRRGSVNVRNYMEHSGLAVSLSIIGVIMCFSSIPFFLVFTLNAHLHDWNQHDHEVPGVAIRLSMIMVFFNNAANWMVYGLVSPSIRREYKRLMRTIVRRMCVCWNVWEDGDDDY